MCLMRLANKIRSLFMSDPTDFLLNTDYEMDKIVYYKSGEVMPNNGESYRYIDEFDLGFIPLVFATLSYTEDFSDTKMNSMIAADGTTISLQAFSDGITLDYHNTVNPNQKLYYRIYAFEPSNSTASVGKTQKDAKQFILNTDYNYCKLYKKGIATSNTTIDHNLGYVPLVLAWQENRWTNPSPGIVIPCWFSGAEDSNYASVSVTSSSVTITGIPANAKVHYRIYYDEV